MSLQIIPLKGRTDLRESAEFWPQRLFAFELPDLSAGCLRGRTKPLLRVLTGFADAQPVLRPITATYPT
jgi:hypothetical protein